MNFVLQIFWLKHFALDLEKIRSENGFIHLWWIDFFGGIQVFDDACILLTLEKNQEQKNESKKEK